MLSVNETKYRQNEEHKYFLSRPRSLHFQATIWSAFSFGLHKYVSTIEI